MIQKINPAHQRMSLRQLKRIDPNSLNTVQRLDVRKRIERLALKQKKIRDAILFWAAIAGVIVSLPDLISFFAEERGNQNETQISQLERLAEQGDADAQFSLGMIYSLGIDENPDYVKKMFFDKNNIVMPKNLVKQDRQKAMNWFKKAAEQNNSKAQTELANSYYWGFTQNYVQAAKWYTKAAELGDAKAQSMLASMYKKGEGVPKNEGKAKALYEKAFKQTLSAVQQGNKYEELSLAGMYRFGEGVEKNLEESVKWYRTVAERGDVRAQATLASMYVIGSEIPRNDNKAFKWYSKAAEQGDEVAQTNLGQMYALGIGVKQDNKKAIALWKEAAKPRCDHCESYTEAESYLNGNNEFLMEMERAIADKMAVIEDIANEYKESQRQ